MSPQRIVFIIAGSIIVVSLLLGYLVSPYWFLMTGFAGLGLVQAGVTGFCPMAKLVTACQSGVGKRKKDTRIETVDSVTLKEWLDQGEAVVVDVREISEYEAAHIPGALLVPLSGCLPASLPQNPNKKIVFHCKAGLRGGSACTLYVGSVPDKIVYNLEGGLDAWIAQGFPVDKLS